MRQGKRHTLKGTLSTALFIALIALLGWYVYQNRADMARLLQLDARTVFWMLLFALCGCVMNCVYHRILLSAFQVPLTLVDWVGVVFVANAMAYVLPMRADLIFSAGYYKRVKGLSYVKSVSMAAGNIVFGVAFALLEMLAALLATGFLEGRWSPALWAVWGVGTACVAAFMVLALALNEKKPAILTRVKLLKDVTDGFHALLMNRRMLRRLLGCLVVNNVFQLLLYVACFRAIGMEISLYQALFYNSVSWISTILSVVPGNVGIKEAVMGLATTLMGAVFQNGVAVSLLQRIAVMLVYLAAGLAFAYPVWRKWNRAAPKETIPGE